jgi:hypothetical protein
MSEHMTPDEREAAKQKVRDEWEANKAACIAMIETLKERKAVAQALANERKENDSNK